MRTFTSSLRATLRSARLLARRRSGRLPPPTRARCARGLRSAGLPVRSPRRGRPFRRRRRRACAAVGLARQLPRAGARPPSLALQPVAAAAVRGDQRALEDERHARAGIELTDAR